MPNTKFIALFVLIGVVGCTSKKEKLAKSIYELETSDSSSTPKGMNDLAEMYYDYAKKFTQEWETQFDENLINPPSYMIPPSNCWNLPQKK